MILFYRLVIAACLSLMLKVILVPDLAGVAALFVFAASGLGVYFMERTDLSPEIKEIKDRLGKAEALIERVDNRTRK